MYRSKVFAISIGLLLLHIYLCGGRTNTDGRSYLFYQGPGAEEETIFTLRSESQV